MEGRSPHAYKAGTQWQTSAPLMTTGPQADRLPGTSGPTVDDHLRRIKVSVSAGRLLSNARKPIIAEPPFVTFLVAAEWAVAAQMVRLARRSAKHVRFDLLHRQLWRPRPG
jgi:hypothetical protein